MLLLEHHWPVFQVRGGHGLPSMNVGAGGRKDPCLSSPQRPNATRKAMDKGLFSMMRMPSSLAVNQELALDSDGFVHSEDSLF